MLRAYPDIIDNYMEDEKRFCFILRKYRKYLHFVGFAFILKKKNRKYLPVKRAKSTMTFVLQINIMFHMHHVLFCMAAFSTL